ncbi:hypothetical protein MMC10_000620 [Thelotrema lepadinum]|nr:hypothetical protein [Thelotrema lepadinum]
MDCPLRSLSKRKKEKNLKHQSTTKATKFKTGQPLAETDSTSSASNSKLDQNIPRSTVSEEAALKADSKSPRESKQRPATLKKKSRYVDDKKAEIAKLTSQRLQDVIPEFDPSSLRSSRRHTYSPMMAPSITVSDETGAIQDATTHQEKNDSLKPMPSVVVPEEILDGSHRQQSNSSTASSSTQSSNKLSVPSLSKVRPRSLFSLRSDSPGSWSETSSTFSSWSRPSSTSSLLPPPLNVDKNPNAGAESSQFYQGRTRDMYSYETLDYQALLDEVSESPSRRLWRKLPFVKKKSSIDLCDHPVPEVAAASQHAHGKPFNQFITKRSWSASTVDSQVAHGRRESPLRVVEPALGASASVSSKTTTTSTSTATKTSGKPSDISSNTEATASSAVGIEDPQNNTSYPLLPGAHPSWRRHVPTRCLEDSNLTKLVRTRNGSRILQLREAVYDAEGKITYKPLMLTSLEADDATRLFLLPLSNSASDVVAWDSTDTTEAIRGEVCLGRDIMGNLVNETVVWARDELDLEGIEGSLGRADSKKLNKAGKGKGRHDQ